MARSFWLLALSLPIVGAAHCGSSNGTPTVAIAEACSINSDCDSPLVCAFGRCHAACAESRDCPLGQRCVSAGAQGVCELPLDDVCGPAALCASGLACIGEQCRNACSATQPCAVAEQTCVAGGCFDPSETGEGGTVDASMTAYAPGADATVDGAEASVVPPWFPNADAGPLGFVPSNLPVLALAGDADAGDAGLAATAPHADVTQGCSNCLPVAPTTIALNDGTSADLYVLDSLTIEETASLRLTGPRAIVLAVLTTVNIQGLLLVNAVGETPGPGGFGPSGNPGPGLGQSGPAYPASLGGGGSYCGVGGAGGFSAPPAAPGGATYGSPTLNPLAGGSGGAGVAYGGSAGGGAIQIVAGTSITVGAFGAINASGGGGQTNTWGGGGSGGGILLEAPSVVVTGNVAANGGGGSGDGIAAPNGGDGTGNDLPAAGGEGAGGNGSAGAEIQGSDGTYLADAGGAIGAGGGGAGRIRINTATGQATVTGIISPSLAPQPDGGPSCATQGTLAQ